MSSQEEFTCGSCLCYHEGKCLGVWDVDFYQPACPHWAEMEEDCKDEQQ